jgi:hypothetical protein
MRPERLEEIANQMERSFRGYAFTQEEAAFLAKRFLRLIEQCVYPFPVKVDPNLPPGTIEARYGDRVVGRIVNIAPD